MAKPYSMDLRDRVVRSVAAEGMSCHAAAARFGVAPCSAIEWMRRYRDTAARRPGGWGPPVEHPVRCEAGLAAGADEERLHAAGFGGRAGRARREGRRSAGVTVCSS